jgi:imidazolonepropionase
MYDLVIAHAGQLVTVAGSGPRRGADMAAIGIIADGAVAVVGDRIAAVGDSDDVIAAAGKKVRILDAGGRVVVPGFVDAHTHLVFAGNRSAEFELRLRGASYLDILAAGGGILSTVQATRQAGAQQLIETARGRLATMLACGTTTAEAKTGYGLELASEIKMLDVLAELHRLQPVSVVPTFMGAHAVPAEYSERPDDYVTLVCSQMLPAVARWRREQAGGPGVQFSFPAALFCDVFCDRGAFTLEQARRILEEARRLGLGLKIHADEFAALGGAALAADLQATSADHLAVTPVGDQRRMAEAGVIGVLLPGTTFGLASTHYADGRSMIDAGMALALGSDLNPGTCYCESMQLMIALACRYQGLLPAEALCAATLNAAWATGVGRLVGSLEPGKLADIVILDVPDHRHLAYRFGANQVSCVIKAGREVYGGNTR